MRLSFLISSFVLVLFISSSALAKGYPNKIILQGNGLTQPIEITDAETLGKFSPWYGQFIEWGRGPAATPMKDNASYEVLFFISGRDKKTRQLRSWMIFSFRYKPDPADGRGLIYLHGPGEDQYRVNQGTIVRDNHDGKWHYASVAWDAALKSRLPAKQEEAIVANQNVAEPRSSRYMIVASSVGGLGVLLVLAMVIRRRTSHAQ